jgi:hypothetical protein
MNQKGKLMLIAAAGALAILVATSVVSCALGRGDDGDAEGTTQTQTEQAGSQPQSATAYKTPEEEAMAVLAESAWRSGNGAELSFREGRFAEAEADKANLATFDVTQVLPQGDGFALTLSVDATKDVDGHDGLVVLEKGKDGVWSVTSDEFELAKTYKAVPGPGAEIKVEGVDSNLLPLIAGDKEGIEKAVQERAAKAAPGATKATWSQQVLMDYSQGMLTTSFTLDDAAKTVITVTYRDGAFEAVG